MSESKDSRHGKHAITTSFLILLGAVVVIGAWWFVRANALETDDAQVDGHIYPVSARIAGTVQWVNPKAEDTFFVEKDAHLVTLDTDDYSPTVSRLRAEIASRDGETKMEDLNVPVTEAAVTGELSQKKAAVIEAEAQVASRRASVDAMRARVAAAKASFLRADADHKRYLALVDTHEISRSEYERHNTEAQTAQRAVDASIADLNAAERNVEAAEQLVLEKKAEVVAAQPTHEKIAGAKAKATAMRASLDEAKAELRRAELDLSYTQIAAPRSGFIGKRNVEDGQRVAVGDLLMTVVPLDELWVTANYKETQLSNVRIGDPVTIHIDTYGKDLNGRVQSIGGATGAKYSALPPENATGNFVKVVQRVPVRIAIDGKLGSGTPIMPGLSVETTIHPRRH